VSNSSVVLAFLNGKRKSEEGSPVMTTGELLMCYGMVVAQWVDGEIVLANLPNGSRKGVQSIVRLLDDMATAAGMVLK